MQEYVCIYIHILKANIYGVCMCKKVKGKGTNLI